MFFKVRIFFKGLCLEFNRVDQAAGFAMTFFQEKSSSHRKILEQFIERHLFDFFSNHFDVARGHMGLGRTRRLGVGSDIFFICPNQPRL